MPDERTAERIWFGDGIGPRFARAALTPLSALFGAATFARNALYDAGVLRTHLSPIPVLSVGNLSVGGTGKTPVAAWLAQRLAAAGARPAIVLRGYGEDEPLVHAQLAPEALVVADADRVAGVRRAAAQGADCAVLDDAFQHRRAARLHDVVLVSADRWTGRTRLLPAGPWREPPRALRRASLLVVTRKTAELERAEALVNDLAPPGVATAVLRLVPDGLAAGERREALGALRGRAVVAAAAIAHPQPFARQLEQLGARVREAFFPDHHAFAPADVALLIERAAGGAWVVCTLKDYVKLARLWPRAAPPLWYVSQHVAPERGEAALDALLASLLAARNSEPRARRHSGI